MRYWSAQSLDTSGEPETFQRDKIGSSIEYYLWYTTIPYM